MSNTQQRGESRKEREAREIKRRNERRDKAQRHAWFETRVHVEVQRV